LYVANALDGTVTRVDAERGRALGPPVPAGLAPWQVVGGPAGRFLVLASVGGAHPSGALRHVAPLAAGIGARPAGERWAVRPVRLEPENGASVLAGRLAGAGRWAAVAYDVRRGDAAAPAFAPRLALIDLRSGVVARTQSVGAGATSVMSLALGGDAAGPIAYLGLWDWSAARGRVLALRADTGAPLAAAPTAGAPASLTLGAAPGGAGAQLYVVEAAPGPEPRDGGDAHASAERWRLRGLDPLTLAPDGERWLAVAPLWFAVASDGDRGYALTGGDTSAGGEALLQLDLASDTTRPLAPPPGAARQLVATRGHLYALDARGDRLWAFDRQSGRLVRTIPVGRRPVALTLDSSWP
jgi:DNA-binding beta-propeller fold protein YncE